MSSQESRYFDGRVEQRKALRAALQHLHAGRHSDQRIVDVLGSYLSRDQIPGHPKATTQPVSRPTIQRIRSASDPQLMGIRPATVGVIYNFLCHCEELQTDLYDETVRIQSAHRLAPLLERLQQDIGAKDGPLTNAKLKSLEGVYHLYNRAWTTPNEEAYTQCILRFDWVGDALFYTEEQKFFDTISKVPVDEIHHGVVMPFGMNAVLIGKGDSKDLLKFFSLHDFNPYPDGHLPVHMMAGNFISVYSKGPHPGCRAYVIRVEPDEAESKFLLLDEIDEVIRTHLQRADWPNKFKLGFLFGNR